MVLIFTVIESARATAERAYIESTGNLGIYSVFGEYYIGLLEKFELFGLYAGDSDGNINVEALKTKIVEYMEYNIEPEKEIIGLLDFKMFTPVISESQISEYMLVTDYGGESFRHQVVEYMKNALGVNGVEALINRVKDSDVASEAQEQYEIEEKNNEKELVKLEEEKRIEEEKADIDDNPESSNSTEQDMGEEIVNPLDTIGKMKIMGILSLVLKEPQNVSGKEIVLSNQVSQRMLNLGSYSEIDSNTSGTINTLLFHEYVLEKFSNVMETRGNASLDYQVEYVIGGKKSDVENLKAVVTKLLLIREGCNFVYLLQDTEKTAEAEALATLLVGAFLLPPLIEVTKVAILLGWAYAESVLDVRNLLDGGKVALFKSVDNWQLSLANIPELLNNLKDTKSSEENGLSYKDYMRVLLGTSDSEKVAYRAMDMVELSVREVSNNDTFKLDNCVVAMKYSSTWKDDFRFISIFSSLSLGDDSKMIIKNTQKFSY